MSEWKKSARSQLLRRIILVHAFPISNKYFADHSHVPCINQRESVRLSNMNTLDGCVDAGGLSRVSTKRAK